jgi:hypothetical protein
MKYVPVNELCDYTLEWFIVKGQLQVNDVHTVGFVTVQLKDGPDHLLGPHIALNSETANFCVKKYPYAFLYSSTWSSERYIYLSV